MKALILTCETCEEKASCKKICAPLKKAITGRHQTAGLKKRTYPIDIDHIQNSQEPLNSFQVGVLNTIANLTKNVKEGIALKMDIEEAVNALDVRDSRIFELFVEGYTQAEMAGLMGVSQVRIHVLLKRILTKLRESLAEGYE